MRVRWNIFVETVKGEIIEAFTWNGSKESGIEVAEYEARYFGYNPINVWAVPAKGS